MPQRPSFFVHWVFFVLNSQMNLFIYYNHGFTFAQICAEFFKIFIYSLIYFLSCTGSLLLHRFFSSCSKRGRASSCSVQVSHCSGFSRQGAQALGHTGFSSYSFQALEHRLSSWAHWLSCSVAGGIFSDQGLNP